MRVATLAAPSAVTPATFATTTGADRPRLGTPEAGVLALAAAVLHAAVKDAANFSTACRDPVSLPPRLTFAAVRADARVWLTSREADVWFETLGYEPAWAHRRVDTYLEGGDFTAAAAA